MYGALWRVLPGPWWLKVLLLLVMASAVVWVCFQWVFPWISAYVQLNENTVG